MSRASSRRTPRGQRSCRRRVDRPGADDAASEPRARCSAASRPTAATIGKRFPAVVRDLSTNGAFISGAPLPLLSRVALKFEVTRHRHDRRGRLGAVAAHRRLRAARRRAASTHAAEGLRRAVRGDSARDARRDRRARRADRVPRRDAARFRVPAALPRRRARPPIGVGGTLGDRRVGRPRRRAAAARRPARSASRSAPAYLASPTWKLEVVVDDDGARGPLAQGRRRFRLAWSDVVTRRRVADDAHVLRRRRRARAEPARPRRRRARAVRSRGPARAVRRDPRPRAGRTRSRPSRRSKPHEEPRAARAAR